MPFRPGPLDNLREVLPPRRIGQGASDYTGKRKIGQGPGDYYPGYRHGRPAPGMGALTQVSAGSINCGPNTGCHGSSDMQQKQAEAKALVSQLSSAITSAQSALNAAKSAVGAANQPAFTAQLGSFSDALDSAQADLAVGQSLVAAPIPPAVQQSYPISEAAWRNLSAFEDAANADLTALQSFPAQLKTLTQQAQDSATAAATAATNAANLTAAAAQNAQTQKDTAAVQRARTQAVASMGEGDYDGALSILQAQPVTDAASRINYDLTPDIQAVIGAKKQATTMASQAQCQSNGGNWVNGACDMSAATARAAAQSACQTAGGLWNGTACDMSAKNAADAQARQDALSGQQSTACATAGGLWTGTTCDMSAKLAADAAARQDAATQAANARADALAATQASACASAGGLWNGVSCDMSAANQQNQLLQSLLPVLLAPQPSAPAVAPSQSYAPTSQGPSSDQLNALALLQALGGDQGSALAAALQGSGALQPQGPYSPAPSGAPDGTPCVFSDGSAGIYQAGACVSGRSLYYGAPANESF